MKRIIISDYFDMYIDSPPGKLGFRYYAEIFVILMMRIDRAAQLQEFANTSAQCLKYIVIRVQWTFSLVRQNVQTDNYVCAHMQ